MERRITAAGVGRTLSDILDPVRKRGERFLIGSDGEPLATLAPGVPVRGIPMSEL